MHGKVENLWSKLLLILLSLVSSEFDKSYYPSLISWYEIDPMDRMISFWLPR